MTIRYIGNGNVTLGSNPIINLRHGDVLDSSSVTDIMLDALLRRADFEVIDGDAVNDDPVEEPVPVESEPVPAEDNDEPINGDDLDEDAETGE